ncbi:MAG: hypothetical protein AAFZ17_03835, partial [Cyanobacteria bacterium J06650_10]
HRDIKPSNILFKGGSDGEPNSLYLVDFGSVHTISQSGTLTVVGTYGYMPPEQFGGRAVPASDLYSLGVTIAYLMTGTHPAERTSSDMQSVIEASSLSPVFKQCLKCLLQADLTQRTSSASVALQQLTTSISSLPATKQSLAPPSVDSSLPRTHQPLSLENSTLKISKTFYEFEIQFFDDRLIGQPFQDYQSTYVFLVTMIVILVFGGLFYGSGLPLLWAAMLAAILLFSIVPMSWNSRRSEQRALALKLSLPSSDALLMRVDKLDLANTAGRLPSDVASFQRTALLSHLQLINIDAIFPPQGQPARLSFLFSKDAKKAPDVLSLEGTQSEIEWLCAQLSQWKDLPIERRTAERASLTRR